jgi:branched-chain amino acid transport system permease protein
MPILTDEAVLAAVGLGIIFAQAFYLTYMTGQLSFGHAAFASVGAYVAGLLSTRLDLPVWLAVAAAIPAGFVGGVLVAVPALRTRHVNLAILTFGVMQIVAYSLGQWDWVGGLSGLGGMAGIGVGDIATVAAAVVAGTWWLERSRLGLAMRAVKQDELAASILGIRTIALRVLSFGIGAAVAAVGGALHGHYNSFVDPYKVGLSVAVNMVFYTIAGGTQVWLGPPVGATILTLLPEFLRDAMSRIDMWRPVLFSAVIMLILVVRPEGLVRRRTVLALGRRLWRPRAAAAARLDRLPRTEAGRDVEIEGLRMQFGGVTALSDISFRIPRGSIFGLIGPNGAGKTTLFNLLTGAYRPTAGHIRVGGIDIAGLPPARIAAHGVARTFQNIRLLPDMTVLENVLVGQSRASPSGLANLTARARATDRALRERADALLETLDLGRVRDRFAIELPYATQRRVEIARALALDPAVLLLDEPTAGMDHAESAEIGALIRLVHRQFGSTILLIEHDMAVVMDLCDRIAVLNFGALIAEGAPADIQGDARVREAYLGQEADA